MPQKIKRVGEFKLGDWVTFFNPEVALEIIAFSADGKSAHVRNKIGVLSWHPVEKLGGYIPLTDRD
jgi:hypothetical protein